MKAPLTQAHWLLPSKGRDNEARALGGARAFFVSGPCGLMT